MASKDAVAAVYVTAIALLIAAAASQGPPATAYANHTVGGDAGWFFNLTTNSSAANYSSWAASQTFGLGDYLIFNTNTNQTVVQTYNETIYRSCSADDDETEGDTFKYGGGSNGFGEAQTVAVALTIVGPNYYFSDAGDDGVQCQRGMAFEIDVQRGLGLPPSLNQPPPPAYVAPPPDSEEGGLTPPTTVVDNQPNGALSTGAANLRWVVCLLLSGGVALFLA